MRYRLFMAGLIIAVLGSFILPQTVSLFAGQHWWYDIDAQGNDVPCLKCHADVADELTTSIQTSGYHDFDGDGKGSNRDCEACHRGTQLNWSSGNLSVPGREAHAASSLKCMLCHSGATSAGHPGGNISNEYTSVIDCSACHNNIHGSMFPPIAGGFNLTTHSWDTGIYASHRPFVYESINSSLLYHANEACIACHTQIDLRFNYTTTKVMGITVSESYSSDGSSVSQSWTFSSAQHITYRVNSTDRTTKGVYQVIR